MLPLFDFRRWLPIAFAVVVPLLPLLPMPLLRAIDAACRHADADAVALPAADYDFSMPLFGMRAPYMLPPPL